MKFQKGDKNVVQNSINELNRIRRDQLEKLNDEILKDMSEEYDDENVPICLFSSGSRLSRIWNRK